MEEEYEEDEEVELEEEEQKVSSPAEDYELVQEY
jgi:hypothetical protein